MQNTPMNDERPELDRKQVESYFQELIKAIISLSLPAEKQREIHGFGFAGEEMVQEFRNLFLPFKDLYHEHRIVNDGQMPFLETLNTLLEEKAASEPEEFWDQLESAGEWNRIRNMAIESLSALGKGHLTLNITKMSVSVPTKSGRDVTIQQTTTELVEKENR